MSIFYGLATRALYFWRKKVTRNRDFSRPAETDPYALHHHKDQAHTITSFYFLSRRIHEHKCHLCDCQFSRRGNLGHHIKMGMWALCSQRRVPAHEHQCSPSPRPPSNIIFMLLASCRPSNTQYTNTNTQQMHEHKIWHLSFGFGGFWKGQRGKTTLCQRQHLIGISPGHKLEDTFTSPLIVPNTQIHKAQIHKYTKYKYTNTNANTKHLLRIKWHHKLWDTCTLTPHCAGSHQLVVESQFVQWNKTYQSKL